MRLPSPPAALNGLSHHERQWLLANAAVGALWCEDKGGKRLSRASTTRYKHTMLHFRLPSHFNSMLAAIGAVIQNRVVAPVWDQSSHSSHWDIWYYLQFTSYTYRSLFLKLDVQHTLIFRSIFKIHHMLFNTNHPSPLTTHDIVY